MTTVEETVFELSNKSVFFVGGLPRSGTTWVQKLIESHPSAKCLGESHFFNDLFPNAYSALVEYSKRREQGVATWAPTVKGFDLEYVRHVLRVSFFTLVAKNLDTKLPSEIAAIGEKTPENVTNLDKIKFLFPDARLIHVIRDPRDGAVSGYARFRSKLDKGMTQAEYAKAYGKGWVERITKVRHESKRQNYYEIQYENLIKNSNDEVRKLFVFLGLPATPQIVEASVAECSFEKLSGGRNRGDADPQSHFRSGMVGSWKETLTSDDATGIERIGQELMRELGYLPNA